MRESRSLSILGVVGVLVASFGCGSGTTNPSTPTAPSYTVYNDTFSDGVLLQGSDINAPDFGPADSPHHFTIHAGSSANPGGIQATITSLSPLSTITVGMGFTTWNAANQSCDLPLPVTTSTAKVGTISLQASISLPGEVCVAVFDVGNVQGSTAYTVSVDHN